MTLFFSTSCLSEQYNYSEILNLFQRQGIKNVELGVCLDQQLNAKKLIKKYGFNYIIHQLFPPPEESFVVNLASKKDSILQKSLNQTLKSIDFCTDNDISFFSFHAGFRGDPNENFRFDFNNLLSYEESFNIFKESIMKIVEYAEERNVYLGIENNVLADYNLKNNRNEIFLMCEFWEFEKIFSEINSKNLGVLLDLGHLKVTANMLNFDCNEFISKIKNYVLAIHIHENNGILDDHQMIKKGDWSVGIVEKYFLEKDIPIVIESKLNGENDLRKYLNFF